MSVYTQLSNELLEETCEAFGVEALSFQPIAQGVENSNWFVEGSKAKYVLTLFEERSLKEVRTLCNLLEALDELAMPVALPLMHELDARLGVLEDKPVILAPRLEGEHPAHISHAQCETMGSVLAKLHEGLGQLPETSYALPAYPYKESLNKHLEHLTHSDAELVNALWRVYEEKNTLDLPKGLIHGDLFIDNTLWQGDNLTGLLDFTEVSIDALLMDFAITANDFCTLWDERLFDLDRYARFLRGYQSVRPLQKVELDCMQVFLATAAARFWLMRLDRQSEFADQTKAPLVQLKSPEPMHWLMLNHLKQVRI